MQTDCTHLVGHIPRGYVIAPDWNSKLEAFVAKVIDFNVRGQREEIPHPGFVQEFRFCPECGQLIDREALGLLTVRQAFDCHTFQDHTQ